MQMFQYLMQHCSCTVFLCVLYTNDDYFSTQCANVTCNLFSILLYTVTICR